MTYSIIDSEGREIGSGIADEMTAYRNAQAWANGNGEACTVVSSEDETEALYDVTPAYED